MSRGGALTARPAQAISWRAALACWGLAAALRWPLEHMRARRERHALRAALAARLEREGVHMLGPRDPRRRVAAQRFWLEEQARAASALHQRFERAPTQLSVTDALIARQRPHNNALRSGLVGLIVMLLLGGTALVLLLPGRRDELVQVLGMLLFGFASMVGVVGAVVVSVEGALIRHQHRTQRRVFLAEQRRLATFAELAGGLTLADSMDDDALVGALSPEVALRGDLERAGGV